jgi:hypothetical protein
LVLVDGATPLRPEPALFDAMITGWCPQLRNPAENGHRFRRKADSVPELSGQRSGVTRTRFRLKADT